MPLVFSLSFPRVFAFPVVPFSTGVTSVCGPSTAASPSLSAVSPSGLLGFSHGFTQAASVSPSALSAHLGTANALFNIE